MRRLLTIGALLAATAGASLYKLDDTWSPGAPEGSHTFSAVGVAPEAGEVYVTQRGNSSIDPVVVLDIKTGKLIRTWGSKFVGLDGSKTPATPTWGAHGLGVERTTKAPTNGEQYRIWIQDFTNHTLTAFSQEGTLLHQWGTNGIAGNETKPVLQFGNLADVAFEESSTAGKPAHVYVTDGDGGFANRVVKLSVPEPTAPHPLSSGHFEWATGHIFHNPHSVAIHERTGLVIVCDREDNETRVLSMATGKDLGVLDCGLDLGPKGRPFGVRTWTRPAAGLDLLYVAVMDNPQDHLNQRIHVIDASGLDARGGAASKCKVIQELTWDPAKMSGPHLLGVDPKSGDLYAALVADAPMSTVLKFKFTGGGSSDEEQQEQKQ